jgi:hypothetical protein
MSGFVFYDGSGGIRALRRTPCAGEVLACWIGPFGRVVWHRAEVLEVFAAVCRVRLQDGAVVRVSVAQLCE